MNDSTIFEVGVLVTALFFVGVLTFFRVRFESWLKRRESGFLELKPERPSPPKDNQ